METMTRLNKETKKAKNMVNSYDWCFNKSKYFDVETFYKNPSYNKIRAWNYCKELCNKNNGHGLRVTGGNSSYFSAGFQFENDGRKYLCYITYANNFMIEL